jgi:hypothetical protein
MKEEPSTNLGTNETVIIKEKILRPGTTISHGQEIGVQCEPQYEASHIVSAPSCHNGTWSHAPKCQPGNK